MAFVLLIVLTFGIGFTSNSSATNTLDDTEYCEGIAAAAEAGCFATGGTTANCNKIYMAEFCGCMKSRGHGSEVEVLCPAN